MGRNRGRTLVRPLPAPRHGTNESDTPAIRYNLKRARAAWGRLSTIIAKEEVPAPVAGMFYQAVVAAVLLYGSKSWVVSAYDLRALEGFHVEAARRLTGMGPKKRGETWVYPHSADVLQAARLKTVAEYIARRRQTVMRSVADRPILEECRGAERLRGSPVRLSWCIAVFTPLVFTSAVFTSCVFTS